MTVPIWSLFGFAVWTLVLLVATVGVYRWSRIFTGRAGIGDFREYRIEGADWYKRAMRAHANCVENLPVFGAIVLALHVSGVRGGFVAAVCVAVLCARVVQSLIHVSFTQTNTVVTLRFTFFFIQVIGFFALALVIVSRAGLAS
ncbi:MAG: MAPEG family protein [Ectothiorhodospiraceae bacterium]|jgi:uncharacterized MAPEG superfamily protein